MDEPLSISDKKILLAIARQAIVQATQNKDVDDLDLSSFSRVLYEKGASFVTLHRKDNGQLRGCIGALDAYQSLVKDVQTHAIAAALEDYRFPPVTFHEVQNLTIEISRLTAPSKLNFTNPIDLPGMLKPGVDGVIIRDGSQQATLLPQVWKQLPDAEDFLTHLCQKMGVNHDYWKKKLLDVSIYQVEEFRE
jgi:AmmeMemoRadiSam system protein A